MENQWIDKLLVAILNTMTIEQINSIKNEGYDFVYKNGKLSQIIVNKIEYKEHKGE